MIKFYALFVSLFLASTSNSFAEVKCNQQFSNLASEAFVKLAADVDKVVLKSYKSIMTLSIDHGGTGDISLLIDENGIILGLRFSYQDNDKTKPEKIFTIRADELNRGKRLEYTPETKGQPSPLRLSAVLPPGITASGASFKLDLATSLSPLDLKPFVIEVRKQGNSFVPRYNNTNVQRITLSPGLSWFKWDGTFKGAAFN